MSKPWITVVGIGEGGLKDLTSVARTAIESAELLVGGERHHNFVTGGGVEQLTWAKGMRDSFHDMEEWRGKRVVVLASGDPFCYGVATTLLKHFEPADLSVIPAPSAFSLACARLKWSLPDTRCLTIHGRPLEAIALHLFPKAQLLLLSRDGNSPDEIAKYLDEKGFGDSRLTVLEHMGGPKEKIRKGAAKNWNQDAADLNVLAIEVVAGPNAQVLSTVPGLPDDVFEHDGQLTKREVRAATLSALQPLPGQLMWDVGAGSGAIAIEWLRALNGNGRAVAMEKNPKRAAAIGRNSIALGVPRLETVLGDAPEVLNRGNDTPDAIFLGGAVSVPGMLETCWDKLGSGGRLVANAVTLEAESRLFEFAKSVNGDLCRIGVSRAESVGRLTGFKPMMTVTQLTAVKP
jgi:precorrin-6Y C5,15-methyltransferase (decarboxylating)